MKNEIAQLLSKNEFSFEDLCTLVSVLRSQEGCPWDREQTNKSIRNCFIDETYEFIEGLDNDDDALMCEELGDVLFQVIFHSQIKKENNIFDINNVIDGICKKMILRHPHVFSDVNVENSEEVLKNWENIKNNEKKRRTPLMQLESVSKALPSLMRAQKLLSKAQKNGLCQKQSFECIIDKAQQELASFRTSKDPQKLSSLLFTLAGAAQNLDVEAEEILYKQNEIFLDLYK